MEKEIGSIFSLDSETLLQAEEKQVVFSGAKIYYSLCREALYDIAFHLEESNKVVLIPAYTCQTVVTPFEEAGWQCAFYSIKRNLRIDTHDLLEVVDRCRPAMIVVHPYFGMELNLQEEAVLKQIGDNGIKIVLDITQCIFSQKRYPFVSFTVGSYRKWFPIPDGGFMEPNTESVHIDQPKAENTEFTEREIAAMYLRGQYFGNGEKLTKAISIRLCKEADHLAENNITPHKLSYVSYNLLKRCNHDNVQRSRFENYQYLYNNIFENNIITKVCRDNSEVTTAPLYFTIYVDNRKDLQRQLAENSIYAPIIWPIDDGKVLINDEVKYIYDHILAIPCDQRYDKKDMQRIVDVLNNY